MLLLVVLLLFGCNTKDDYKTILLKTTGYVETLPNEASILVQINCIDKNIEQAKNCLIEKASKLNTVLSNCGIQKQDILTTGINLNKSYVWRNNSNVFNGFNASTSMNIKIHDLNLLDNLYTKLLSNEQLTISSLSYSHNKIDSLNEIAYVKALENANRIADKILTQVPEKNKIITKVSNIEISESDNEIDNETKYKVALEYNAPGKSNMEVNIGNMIVEQQLFVEFKIY
jgi:uncharacterized protein YggE